MPLCFLQDRQQAEEEAKLKEAELMRGNPLINMNNAGSFNVKRRLKQYCSFLCRIIAFFLRMLPCFMVTIILLFICVLHRWDDDVVFKNQARGETKTPKRFINDTIRSDFHRKFLHRYMK
jgi:protein CWC15